jgi:hypothetical protein
MILEAASFTACPDLGLLEKATKGEVIAQLGTKGLSIRQISRLTDIGRNIVQKAKG